MIDDMLIGPVILDDLMTGQNYLDFLQNELPKQLEDVPLATRIAMYFQLDGAPSHYTRHVMQHLNDTFPNRWIGRGSTINWPPRSPDLTSLDFCLWGLMKNECAEKKWIHETNCSLTCWMHCQSSGSICIVNLAGIISKNNFLAFVAYQGGVIN